MDSQPLEIFKNDYQVWLGFGANCYKPQPPLPPLTVQTLEGSESIPNLHHRTLQHYVCKASLSQYCRRVPTQTRNSEHGADGGNGLLPACQWRQSGTWHRPGSPSLPERHRAGTADCCRCRKATELEYPCRFPMFLPKSQYFNWYFLWEFNRCNINPTDCAESHKTLTFILEGGGEEEFSCSLGF